LVVQDADLDALRRRGRARKYAAGSDGGGREWDYRTLQIIFPSRFVWPPREPQMSRRVGRARVFLLKNLSLAAARLWR
jgi:hypothetical protein